MGRGYFIFGGDKRKERLNAGEKKQRRLQLKKSATKMLRDPPFNSEIASPFLKATKASGLGSTFFFAPLLLLQERFYKVPPQNVI